MARAFGEVALSMREYTGSSPASAARRSFDAVLRHAWREDQTGALALYAMPMVVGPRLLVSLRDAHERASTPGLRELSRPGPDGRPFGCSSVVAKCRGPSTRRRPVARGGPDLAH